VRIFFKKEVEFLGFLIADGGIKTNPENVRAVAEIPYSLNT